MISICTACTPWYPLPELLPRLAAVGYQGIEVGVKPHVADPAEPPSPPCGSEVGDRLHPSRMA
jgi:hypothetical protein